MKRPTKSVNVSIVICECCEGEGTLRREELTNYHRNEYRVWTEPCDGCDGTGRVRQTVTALREVMSANQ